jgi:hypothetical protein
MEEDGRILANRIEQDGFAELSGRLAENMNALGFEELEMRRMKSHCVAAPTRVAYLIVAAI